MDKKEKWNEYMRDYRKKNYRNYRNGLLERLGGKCVVCGSADRLEIDHKDPKTKEFDPSAYPPVSKARVDREMAKCQLLCHDCHFKKSLSDYDKKSAVGTHGTLSSYRYCKCDLCRKAKTDWMREYKRARRLKNLKPVKG